MVGCVPGTSGLTLDFPVTQSVIVLSIKPHNLHWLSVEALQNDLCAHGGVMIERGNRALMDQRNEEWALSAAALMLLRTLNEERTADHRVGEQLFPHCGHVMYAQGDSDDVLIIGCPSGLDFEVRHRDGQVEIELPDQPPVGMSPAEWRAAALWFSEAITAFYAASSHRALIGGLSSSPSGCVLGRSTSCES